MRTLKSYFLIVCGLLSACGEGDVEDQDYDASTPEQECALCEEGGKADAFGIARESYLAYGIIKLANSASLTTLDDDVALDSRAAQGIVDRRPFEYIEQIDTVPYVGKVAFERLASYAKDNGFVPYCGDGGLEALLERCDDGNTISGDGCSSTCEVEAQPQVNLDFFRARTELIEGKDIGVSLVNAQGFYLRERTISTLTVDEDVEAILTRADGILANSRANGKVSFDELALMSKSPFYDSLFTKEREALRKAWSYFEVSVEPMAEVHPNNGTPIETRVPFTTNIVRPGPWQVNPIRISSLEDVDDQTVARRLQQLPGLNKDQDVNTVDWVDVEAGLTDYPGVFTSSELYSLKVIKEALIEGAEHTGDGDYSVTYKNLGKTGVIKGNISTIDGFEFNYGHELNLFYDSYAMGSPDVNIVHEFRFWQYLHQNGKTAEGVRYVSLSGERFNPRAETGIVLMEQWKGTKRVYNRVVRFRYTFGYTNSRKNYENKVALARPVLEDGTPLTFAQSGYKTYYKSGSSYRFKRFRLKEAATVFNNNMRRFAPDIHEMMKAEIEPGRYIWGDVKVDVHASNVIVVEYGSCQEPMYLSWGLQTESCGGRSFSLSTRSGLKLIQRNNNKTEEIELIDLERDLSDVIIP